MAELTSAVKKGKEYNLTVYTGKDEQWAQALYYQLELAQAREKPIIISGSALRAQVLKANIKIDDYPDRTVECKVTARVKMVY